MKELTVSSPDFSNPPPMQEAVSPSGEYISLPIVTHTSRMIEFPSSSLLKSSSEMGLSQKQNVAMHGTSTAKVYSHVDFGPKKIEAKDKGWWLVFDIFVRQEKWSQLAILSPSYLVSSLEERSTSKESFLNRTADIVVALTLLILLMPVLAFLVIIIPLESRGPALFCHRRVGKGGAEFSLWKFRSMRIDALKYERSPTCSTDSRITRIGKLIRRVSLDEIPQLINVLKGEMSLVGPRPEMAFIVNQYTHLEHNRLLVKPGITGLWQISSGRAVPIHHNLQYDFYYIKHKNVLLDIAILLRTISAVIHGIGAV